MKKYVFIFITVFSITFFSQNNNSTIFKVMAQSEISVKADLIIFRIIISEENPDPEKAYKIHKEKERKLAELIHNLGINDSCVSYSLLSISKIRFQKNDNYKTQQTINLKLRDFDLYEKTQIELLKNNINEFRSAFSSTKIDKIRAEGIRELVQSAKKEAEIYAENLGLKVGDVIEIDTKTRNIRGNQGVFFRAKQNTDYSLSEFPRSYTVKLFADITFELIK